MKERLRLLGGTMMIDSRPNEGTTLTFTIPLPEVN
jgi:signal transduction histidine kinase